MVTVPSLLHVCIHWEEFDAQRCDYKRLDQFLDYHFKRNSSMSEFGLKYFMGYLLCKRIVLLNQVLQGVSLCTTCLLSCFQAVTISPRSNRQMELKHRDMDYVGLSCSLSWLVHLLLNIMIPIRVSVFRNRETE